MAGQQHQHNVRVKITVNITVANLHMIIFQENIKKYSMTKPYWRPIDESRRTNRTNQDFTNYNSTPLHYLGQLAKQDLKSCSNTKRRGKGIELPSVSEGLLTLIIKTDNIIAENYR